MLAALAACSSDGSCKQGITFYIGDIAGSLKPSSTLPVTICFDAKCQVTTVSHSQTAGSVFLAFDGVSASGDHTITVTAEGGVKGHYKGPLDHFDQASGGGRCALAAVKIGADGTITPGRVPTTTIAPPTTKKG